MCSCVNRLNYDLPIYFNHWVFSTPDIRLITWVHIDLISKIGRFF